MQTVVLATGLCVLAMCRADKPTTCTPTTPDELGPYYYPGAPMKRQICDRDRMFHRRNHLLVEGRVLDEQCNAVVGAKVEVWQADHDGHYLFKDNCRGHFFTATGGHYAFLTMHPGKYSTDPTKELFRPAHVHFRIEKPGFNILVTQMYFSGDPSLGRNDSCTDCSSASEDLVIEPTEMCADKSGAFCFNIAHFDIVLRAGHDIDVVPDTDDSLPELLDASETGK